MGAKILNQQAWATAEDGQPVYYEVAGKGPAIVCCNGVGCSTDFWHHISTYFRDSHQILKWDYRGHGLTPMPDDFSTLTVEQAARDLKTVLDETGIKKATLLGHSMGTQVILEFYRQFPENVEALVPVLGTYGDPASTFFDFAYAGELVGALLPIAQKFIGVSDVIKSLSGQFRLGYNVARLVGIINPSLAKTDEMDPYFDHLSKMDIGVFLTTVESVVTHSAEDIIELIDIPTLVVGGEYDLFTPSRVSQEMFERIPNSELLTLPGGSHAGLVEQPELLNLRLEKFFADRLADTKTVPKMAKKRTSTRVSH